MLYQCLRCVSADKMSMKKEVARLKDTLITPLLYAEKCVVIYSG